MKNRIRNWKRPHDVYRVYDKDGILLYVGCTVNVERRIKQHKAEYAGWCRQAATVTVEEYADFATARAVESLAIHEERPVWNVTKMQSSRYGRGAELCRTEPTETYAGLPMSFFWKAAA